MITSGDLDQRVRFERRVENAGGASGDAFGRNVAAWVPKFGAEDGDLEERQAASERWARFESKTGRETFAGRVEGQQAFELAVRRDPDTLTITNKDRVIILIGSIYCNIQACAPHPTEPREFLLMTLVAGGANG